MARDKLLFTPGPLGTSKSVKEAMLRDVGSREPEFIEIVRGVRQSLLALGRVSQEQGFEAVLMQGSGTFALESVLCTMFPPTARLLVVSNGTYGDRIAKIAEILGVESSLLRVDEQEPPDPARLSDALERDPTITHVAAVHCETSSGMLNPIEALGAAVHAAGRSFVVDAMSSFGGVPLSIEDAGIDVLVSSSNKCIEGVPGFAFAVCRRAALLAAEGNARSLSLDLLAQWRGLESDGMFRFTPPTHAILAFAQALRELAAEGGIAARAERYSANQRVLREGMGLLGFETYLPESLQSGIITSFREPADANFQFEEFAARLSDRGFAIYPAKLPGAECFRIGTIGHLFERDIRALLGEIPAVLKKMNVVLLENDS